MPKPGAIPDAWDEDWETLADKPEPHSAAKADGDIPISNAERKAKHAEQNRAIWESAENPEPQVFLPARDNIPLQSSFKPNVTVLSRKPPPRVISRSNGSASMAGLSIEDDDSEEERRKRAEESFAERKARAEKEREEKLRKYAEAREKIFGSPAPSSGDSRGASPSKSTRGRGRGRGGRDGQMRSSAEQSPVRPTAAGKQLYDPTYAAKPNSLYHQKRDSASSSRASTPNGLQQPIREPRGPHGRGFAPRGR